MIGLGEREWLAEIEDDKWHDIEDPEKERRKKGAFAGLKNLGATCYVNTYLQVLMCCSFVNLSKNDLVMNAIKHVLIYGAYCKVFLKVKTFWLILSENACKL